MAPKTDISARLAQWKLEATTPQHPNYYHADFDQAMGIYTKVSALLQRLRHDTDAFSREDVTNLFGTLNSGNRMKNLVAKENKLPKLRQALLEMLDGRGEPIEKIETANQKIAYAGQAMLGELYGWAHIENAPVYNACATNALHYLGYTFNPQDYNAFVANHEQFKQVYQQQVGRLNPEIPLNMEMDKLYNVIDKVDLKEGTTLSTDTRHPQYWRITLPEIWQITLDSGEKTTINIWQSCLEHGIAAIDFDGNKDDYQVQKFMNEIQVGDKVVAFLLNKTIGGIGTVTQAYDDDLFKNQPADQDYWQGKMWFRLGVDWQPVRIKTTDLPEETSNMFYGQTIMKLTATHYQTIMNHLYQEPEPAINGSFPGFSPEAFRFLTELSQNNNKAWMDENRTRYKTYIRHPFKTLFEQIGPRLKATFDPYLVPDELEIAPKSGKTLANINRQWVVNRDPYYEFFWGAFYRASLSKQTDAQLYMNIFPDSLRLGFYISPRAVNSEQFRQRVTTAPHQFWQLLEGLNITQDYLFAQDDAENGRIYLEIDSPEKLVDWVSFDNALLERKFKPGDPVIQTSRFTEVVIESLCQLFPVYLWAVADSWETAVEDYLNSLEPLEDEDALLTEPYTQQNFLANTYLPQQTMSELQELLLDKNQIILYGPPGTGKSFVAQELAKLITEQADPPHEQVEMIQFHPAYSYEDFIEGIKPESIPVGDGTYTVNYPTRPGVFTSFCQNARKNPNVPHLFIIDEINRGNIARIFGELMLLLEYRERTVPLPYSKTRFRIPDNVYIIGTMNTADRSIALVDFALRRRFHFFKFGAEPDILDSWLAKNPVQVPYVGQLYRALIEEKAIDDPDYEIGPSHFMKPGLTESKLEAIWRRSIEPYLREYYLEQPKKAENWDWDSDHVAKIRNQYG